MGVFLVYDISDATSFENVMKVWLPLLEQHAPPNICKMLVGSKSDLTNRVVEKSSGEVSSWSCAFSSKEMM